VHDGRGVRLDGIMIADSLADLNAGQLSTSINVTETGAYHSGWQQAWTGANPDGTAAADHCSSWADSTTGFHGQSGSPVDASSAWTFDLNYGCSSSSHLYCFSDVPSYNWIFGDGFESGDVSAW